MMLTPSLNKRPLEYQGAPAHGEQRNDAPGLAIAFKAMADLELIMAELIGKFY